MQITNHPDDERLAALAVADPEATGDVSLSEHVAACQQCATVVSELRGLRAALAELPDPELVPPRPFRLLPPVAEPRPSFADRVGGVVRRAFAPALTAGAALALVGVVGTTGVLQTMYQQSGPAGAPAAAEEAAPSAAVFVPFTDAAAPAVTPGSAPEGAESFASQTPSGRSGGYLSAAPSAEPRASSSEAAALAAGPTMGASRAGDATAGEPDAAEPLTVQEERSIWPVVLAGGVALIILAVLLRWIFKPQAA